MAPGGSLFEKKLRKNFNFIAMSGKHFSKNTFSIKIWNNLKSIYTHYLAPSQKTKSSKFL